MAVLQPPVAPLGEGVGEYLDSVALDDLHTAALLSHYDHHQQHEGDPHVTGTVNGNMQETD